MFEINKPVIALGDTQHKDIKKDTIHNVEDITKCQCGNIQLQLKIKTKRNLVCCKCGNPIPSKDMWSADNFAPLKTQFKPIAYVRVVNNTPISAT